jgi:hypothetical protein
VKQKLTIVSGGQTGVDRAALDTAIGLGIPHGGWCPKGRLAEDGPLSEKYALKETRSKKYAARTEKNIVDSDGTLILYVPPLVGGTALTQQLAVKHQKPYRLIVLDDTSQDDPLAQWIEQQQIRVLNIAGPRESQQPGIYEKACRFLRDWLGEEESPTNSP